MAKKKSRPDELEITLKQEFEPIYNMLKDIESFIERNLIEIEHGNLEDLDIDSLSETINELSDRYNAFLDEVLTMAGEIQGDGGRGKEAMDKLKSLQESLERITWNVQELKNILKNVNVNSEQAFKVAEDFITNINKLILKIRTFISQEIPEILDSIFKELKKIETYYEY